MNIEKTVELIEGADGIMICAGAGMGVDSGLPDFRGNEGFWKAYPPYKDLGLEFTEMANPTWFKSKPEFAWGFYGHRLNLYRKTIPHKGFEILFELTKKKKNNYFIFTSNVDGQFQKAGFSDDNIVECHGSIHHLQCIDGCGGIWEVGKYDIIVEKETMLAKNDLPHCPKCGSIARPNILMFGDWDWVSMRTDTQYNKMDKWFLQKQKLVIIELGAGTAVPTVRYMSESIIKKYNASLIRINIREPNVPYGQIGISLGALEALALIRKGKREKG